ncbi:MAG: transposase [Synechococcaceae cyanobacterium]
MTIRLMYDYQVLRAAPLADNFPGRRRVSGELGLDLLDLEHQLFHQWHRWRADEISREHLQELTDPIRLDFETTLQWASDLGFVRGEKTPWATTVRTCRQILTVAPAFWTFLGLSGVEPTNNAAERALRQAVIYRKVCFGVQSAAGGRCLSRLLTVTTSLKQQGRDALEFMVAAWNAHYYGMPAPSLIPQAQ